MFGKNIVQPLIKIATTSLATATTAVLFAAPVVIQIKANASNKSSHVTPRV